MDVRFWAATDVGRTRDHNEDNFLVDKKLNLFVVADGMGGHAAGEVASSVAVREVRRVISENREVVEAYKQDENPKNRENILSLCESAIETACARVYQLAVENPSRKGMGTTLTLLLVAGHRGFIGHVGDSRIYLVRRSSVHQITEDHSLLNELIKRGRLKPGDAFDSPYKNAVTRAVGVYETVEVDAFDIDVLPDDGFLLCSDGLSCYLEDDMTRSYMAIDELKDIPDKFIHFANECGGKDNITAIVVRIFEEQERERLSERVTLVQRKTSALQANALFRFLNYRDIVKVMNGSERRHLKAGELLMREGTRFNELFIVLTGRLSVSRGGVRIGELQADDAIGEPILISNAPCDVTATAVEDSEILCLSRQSLHDLMSDNATLGWKLLWSLSQTFHSRLRAVDAELFRAAQSIGDIAQASPALQIEKPQLFAVSCDGATHGFRETDELVPPFFDGTTDGGTDPIITFTTEGASQADEEDTQGDMPIDSLAPQDEIKGAPLSIQNTAPDLRAKDLVDLQRFGPGRGQSGDENT